MRLEESNIIWQELNLIRRVSNKIKLMLNQRGLNNSNWQINSIKEEMANNKICNNKNLKNHKKKGKKKYTKMSINRW